MVAFLIELSETEMWLGFAPGLGDRGVAAFAVASHDVDKLGMRFDATREIWAVLRNMYVSICVGQNCKYALIVDERLPQWGRVSRDFELGGRSWG